MRVLLCTHRQFLVSSGGLFCAGLRLPTSAALASSSVRISLRPLGSGVGAGVSEGNSVAVASTEGALDVGVDDGSSATGVSDGVALLTMAWVGVAMLSAGVV